MPEAQHDESPRRYETVPADTSGEHPSPVHPDTYADPGHSDHKQPGRRTHVVPDEPWEAVKHWWGHEHAGPQHASEDEHNQVGTPHSHRNWLYNFAIGPVLKHVEKLIEAKMNEALRIVDRRLEEALKQHDQQHHPTPPARGRPRGDDEQQNPQGDDS